MNISGDNHAKRKKISPNFYSLFKPSIPVTLALPVVKNDYFYYCYCYYYCSLSAVVLSGRCCDVLHVWCGVLAPPSTCDRRRDSISGLCVAYLWPQMVLVGVQLLCSLIVALCVCVCVWYKMTLPVNSIAVAPPPLIQGCCECCVYPEVLGGSQHHTNHSRSHSKGHGGKIS